MATISDSGTAFGIEGDTIFMLFQDTNEKLRLQIHDTESNQIIFLSQEAIEKLEEVLSLKGRILE